MKRIAIIGSGGAGKSTLARELGEMLGIEVIHLDALFWKPGWMETPKEEWAKLHVELLEKEAWVMDGNYGGTMQLRLEAADTVIYLDFPTYLCLWRIVKRRWMYGRKQRPDMAEGCKEHIDWAFFRWVATYRRKRRVEILRRIHSGPPDREVWILRNPSEVRSFLDTVRRQEKK